MASKTKSKTQPKKRNADVVGIVVAIILAAVAIIED